MPLSAGTNLGPFQILSLARRGPWEARMRSPAGKAEQRESFPLRPDPRFEKLARRVGLASWKRRLLSVLRKALTNLKRSADSELQYCARIELGVGQRAVHR